MALLDRTIRRCCDLPRLCFAVWPSECGPTLPLDIVPPTCERHKQESPRVVCLSAQVRIVVVHPAAARECVSRRVSCSLRATARRRPGHQLCTACDCAYPLSHGVCVCPHDTTNAAAQPVAFLLTSPTRARKAPLHTLHVVQPASHSGRCHVSSWVAPKTWNVTDMPARFSCRPHARVPSPHPRCPCTSTSQRAIVATASLVFTHSRLDAVPVCHAPGRHPYQGSTDLPQTGLQGVGSSSVSQGQDLSSVLVETSVYAPSGLL
jgi:hypothetical protein